MANIVFVFDALKSVSGQASRHENKNSQILLNNFDVNIAIVWT